MFLLPNDYESLIQEDILDDILRDNPNSLQMHEGFAVGEMASYLNIRYDIGKIFPDYQKWDKGKEYQEGNYVVSDGNLFLAKAESTGIEPEADPEPETEHPWVKHDPRHPVIVLYCLHITLYHAHQALPGKQIPQLRIDNYDIAIKWLSKVAAGQLKPNLPEMEDNSKNQILFNSNPRRVQHL
jgi:hypothetical protein